ncbi:sulfotransferase family 2 domain-containing protein [Salipiger mucosus]|uniref:Sulfotransferase family protein n=1 Tax=Salipiger mucosus DSM 16094 TaxID=1123237 RepID=S9Q967_9RHOB|nr:sulfotransferase family 2 domain-containing protein [Salipiger mucosus]EPX76133.1 hypothetical protein Salmuc_01297 [Salipiger mucosus DSM 16094]
MVIAVGAHRIACMVLPKAGCSSVKAALAQIDPLAPPGVAGDLAALHARYPTRRFRPHRWAAVAHCWRFCVVRDPLARLLSVYTDRVRDRGELRNCRSIRRGRVDLPVDPSPDVFFANLRAYMAASSVIRHHALPARLFVGPDPGAYDRVFRLEELPLLGRELSRRSGRVVEVGHRNASRARLGLADLGPAARAAVEAHVAGEYDFLAGFYENPFVGRVTVPCAGEARRVS